MIQSAVQPVRGHELQVRCKERRAELSGELSGEFFGELFRDFSGESPGQLPGKLLGELHLSTDYHNGFVRLKKSSL